MISGCGELQEGSRIIDGETADPNSIPWQVRLQARGYMCGGTIVCPNFVLTAAHCMDNMSPRNVEVFAAEHDANDPYDHEKHQVKQIHRHPRWVPSGDGPTTNIKEFDYDYAILELKRPIDLSENSNARAACLPSRSDKDRIFRDGTKFVVSGWGLNNGWNENSSPAKLHHTTISWLEKMQCGPGLTEQMFCAGEPGRGKGTCSGDSGGDYFLFFPLFAR